MATVNLYFDLATLPQNCQYYHITCLNRNEETTKPIDTPRTDFVPLNEVPITTNLIQILYRETEDGETVATSEIPNSKVPKVELKSGDIKHYRQGEHFDITPVEPQLDDVTVNVTNCYASLNDVAKITAKVTVDGQDYPFNDVDYSAEGTYSFTVPGDDLTNGDVSSVVLYYNYDDQNIPFEWIDCAEPVAPDEDSKVSLDVNENKVAGGSGTAEDPYLVANPRQLDNVRNYLTACYKQIKDIYFDGSCGGTLGEDESGTSVAVFQSNGDANARFKGDAATKTYGWEPIGGYSSDEETLVKYFTGTYDGCNKIIKGLVTDYQYREDATGNPIGMGIGLFGAVQGATLKHINLQNCQLIGYVYVGSVCGIASAITLDSCTAKETNIYGVTFIGGLVGYDNLPTANNTTISDCTFQGHVTLNKELYSTVADVAGGIIGGIMPQEGNPAGGYIYKISGCSVEGSVGSSQNESLSNSVGGIVGCCYDLDTDKGLELVNNTNNAAVQGYSKLGGIIGYCTADLVLDKCQNKGSIKCTKPFEEGYAGGVVGYTKNVPTFANATTSTGTITVEDATRQVGGIVGYAYHDETTETEIAGKLKTAMQGGKVATPKGMVDSDKTKSRGQYCGSPFVDSL